MAYDFSLSAFVNLLEGLAGVKGPSLGEAPRRKYLEDFFLKHSMAFSVDQAGNLWVRHGQGTWDDAVVFDAHIDVVQRGYAPTFDIRDDLISGMGVADNLTAVALLALFAVSLHDTDAVLERPLYFLFSTGEEGDGNLKGIRHVVSDYITPPYGFISFDLSFDEYSVAGLGSLRYRLDVTCPGGHSWSDYGIPNAIDQMMSQLIELKDIVKQLTPDSPGQLSFNIGTFTGGEGINSIARQASASFELRSPSRGLLETLDSQVTRTVRNANGASGCDLTCSLTSRRPAAGPISAERLEPFVLKALESVGETTQSVIRSTNINATLDAGWPSICLGLCTGGRFHTHDEFIRLDSVEKGWRVLEILTHEILSKNDG